MAAFAVLVSAILIGYPLGYDVLFSSILVFLISSGGMVLNDYFDHEIDKINKPKRPIPSGRISKNVSLLLAAVLFLSGLTLSLLLNIQIMALAILNTFLLVIYSWKLKRVVLIGNLTVAWLTASSFLFGSLLKGVFTINILILFMMIFMVSVGREIIKSIEDVEGDRKNNVKTLPVVFGEKFSGWLAMIFIFFGIISSPVPYFLGLMNVYYVVLVSLADLIFAISCFVLFFSPKKSQKYIKIGMFIGLIAFLAGTIII